MSTSDCAGGDASLAGSVPATTRVALPDRGVCAHRGGAASAPENTLAAFRHAGTLGVHQIEFDTRRSSDGELVVIHDASVDRTTDGRGNVCDLSLAELRRLDASGRGSVRHRNERIPTLEEALAVMPNDVWINLQIKRGEPIAEEVARLVVDSGRARQVVIASGNDAGQRARSVHPDLLLCNLARQRSRARYVDHAIATGSDFIQFHYARGPVEPALADRAHRAGLRVNFFCAPGVGADDLCELFSLGVDFVLVDDLPLALEAARRAGIEPLARPESGGRAGSAAERA